LSDPAASQLVVIVEDDEAIAAGLALNLKLHGYRTEVAADGEAAPPLIAAVNPDLVLLDISLPKKSGIWVLETLRGGGNHVPVLVLSARQDEFDKVAALHLGADDYVTKPFALAELLARIAALLRRAGAVRAQARIPVPPPPAAPQSFRFGDVAVEVAARTVTRSGKPVKLTHLEFELLSFFCCNEARVFSREELLRQVWGVHQASPARTVDNFVAQLRTKLEVEPDRPVYLLTVRGSGYRFVGGPKATS